MKLPSFWEEIGYLVGDQQLVSLIYNIFQWIVIGLIIIAILVGVVVTLAQSIKVWACDNEETKKQLKLTRSKFLKALLYIFVGLIAIEVIWNIFLPPIINWAVQKGANSALTSFNCLPIMNLRGR